MKTFYKLITIVFAIALSSLANVSSQTDNGNISFTDNQWVYDNDRDEYYYLQELTVTPNKPIKFNYTIHTFDYLNIYTIDSNGYSKRYILSTSMEPCSGSITVISSTNKIYVSLNWGWESMNTGQTVLNLTYQPDTEYTINTNPSIINNDQYIAGKLGIGVQPTEKFEVNGSARINNRLSIGVPYTANYNLFVSNENNSSVNTSIYNTIDKNSTSSVYGLRSYTTNYSGNTYGIYSSVGGVTAKKWAGYFTGGDVVVMSGYIGVGTSTPKAIFDISGQNNYAIPNNRGTGGLAVTAMNLDPYFGDYLNPFKTSRKLILGWNYSGGRGEQSFFANGPATLAGGFSFYNYTDDATTASHLMTIEGSGKVGIGTTTPKSKLEISTGVNATPATTGANQTGGALRLRGADNAVLDFGLNSVNTWIQATDQTALNMNYNISLNPNGGNVGIGTTDPKAKLDVGTFINGGQLGTVFGRLSEGNTTGSGTFLGVKGYDTAPNFSKSFAIEHNFYGQTNSSINFFRGGDATGGFITFNTSTNSEKMRINASGNVGIGTVAASDPTGALLTVKGKIHAEEVIIDLSVPAADYVFNSDYSLMPLHKVEAFVKTNKHLPEIPSAAEVKEKGLSMGEMQNKLLQKIEELTLYVIEQQKQIEEQSAKIEELETKVK